MFVHLTVQARPPHRPFADWETAKWSWTHLRAAFPLVAACALMPNHPHLVAEVSCIQGAASRFIHVLAQLGHRLGLAGDLWTRFPPPSVVEPGKLARNVRYVALNPCRAQLCGDPLEWEWSTYRDALGAVDDPWVRGRHLASLLRMGTRNFPRDLHAYVSADPSVAVAGTSLPQSAPQRQIAEAPLGTIVKAAAVATRSPVSSIKQRGPTRRAFVQLAKSQGARDTALLARMCGTTRRTIQRLACGEPTPAVAAALLCLGDKRLLWSRLHEPVQPLAGSTPPAPPRIAAQPTSPTTTLWSRLTAGWR